MQTYIERLRLSKTGYIFVRIFMRKIHLDWINQKIERIWRESEMWFLHRIFKASRFQVRASIVEQRRLDFSEFWIFSFWWSSFRAHVLVLDGHHPVLDGYLPVLEKFFTTEITFNSFIFYWKSLWIFKAPSIYSLFVSKYVKLLIFQQVSGGKLKKILNFLPALVGETLRTLMKCFERCWNVLSAINLVI